MESDPKRIESTSTVRERILRRFEAWLEATLAAEEPPAGLAAEILDELNGEATLADAGVRQDVDLYALWSSLTALAQEIKLQGRSFKQLHDGLSPWSERVEQALDAQAEALSVTRNLSEKIIAEREALKVAAVREIEQRVRQERLELLLDLRDRLVRGVETAYEHRAVAQELLRPGFFGLFKRRGASEKLLEAVEAIESGCALSLGRLDDALHRSGVEEIVCRGRPFDPVRMKAVELLETSEVAAGTVLEVYRCGYERNGEVFRPAEVKIAQAPRGPLEEKPDES